MKFEQLKNSCFVKYETEDGLYVVSQDGYRGIRFSQNELFEFDDIDYIITDFMEYDHEDITEQEAREILTSMGWIEEEREILGKTKDGIKVYAHPETHSHRPDLNIDAIAKIKVNGRPFIRETVDMGRFIGMDHLVETDNSDEIIYFQRGNRPNKSRMVLNRKAKPTRKVTTIICKGGPEDGNLEGEYILVTLFEGEPGMPERKNDPECTEFWQTHALVPTKKELEEIKSERSST